MDHVLQGERSCNYSGRIAVGLEGSQEVAEHV